MDTGFCPKCIEVDEPPIIKKDMLVKEQVVRSTVKKHQKQIPKTEPLFGVQTD